MQEPPVGAAFSPPVYSNAAPQFLAYALEAITHRSMSEIIDIDVSRPFGMSDSSRLRAGNRHGRHESRDYPAERVKHAARRRWRCGRHVLQSQSDMVKLGQSNPGTRSFPQRRPEGGSSLRRTRWRGSKPRAYFESLRGDLLAVVS